MEHEALIQRLMDYIENNLKAEITLEELAGEAGYSCSHFSRIFREHTGLTVLQYLNRRRLLHAAYEIYRGVPVIETALAYGYATKAGFYKAFIREFGVAPTVYAEKHELRPPHPIRLSQEEHVMLTKKQIEKLLSVHWNISTPVTDYYWPGTGERADDVWNIGGAYLKANGHILSAGKAALLSEKLVRAGIPAEMPVRTLRGDILAEEGELGFVLYQKGGEPFLSKELIRDLRGAENLGRCVGKLDKALAGITSVENPVMDMYSHLKDWAVPAVRQMGDMDESFWRWYLNALEEYLPRLPKQLIHRDPHASNVLKSGGCHGLELAQDNIRLFDPCYASTSILSETWSDPDSGERWFEVFHAILSGYDAENPLTQPEKEAAAFVVFSIQLICVAYFSGAEKFSELYRTNLGMLKFLAGNIEKLRLT